MSSNWWSLEQVLTGGSAESAKLFIVDININYRYQYLVDADILRQGILRHHVHLTTSLFGSVVTNSLNTFGLQRSLGVTVLALRPWRSTRKDNPFYVTELCIS